MTPDYQSEFVEQMRRFNLGQAGESDCPVYDGMFDYFQALPDIFILVNPVEMPVQAEIHISLFAKPYDDVHLVPELAFGTSMTAPLDSTRVTTL